MTVQELINELSSYPKEWEVRIINGAIEDNGNCPTFKIEDVASVAENLDEDFPLPEDKPEDYEDYVLIEINDDNYIKEDYCI